MKLPERMHISLPVDENGLVGRECPVSECEGYFKIKLGTGIVEEGYNKCYCPYCGHESTQDHFLTKEQVEYAKSVAVNEIQKVLGREIEKWDRKLRASSRNSFIKLRVNYKQSRRPIAYYAEKELETNLICETCTLEYAVYGKFAYCPDCGVTNTLQILNKNLELARRQLVQAKTEESKEFQDFLIQSALTSVVSAFDSFGRNSVKLFVQNTTIADFKSSFQNITKAREGIQTTFGFDISDRLDDEEWGRIVINFQKRHLISHNDGIVDEVYLQVTNDPTTKLGRKVIVTAEDVDEMLSSIETIAKNLQANLANWKSLINDKGD